MTKDLAVLQAHLCPPASIEQQVSSALSEDLGGLNPELDVSAALIAAERRVSARLITREAMVLCGRAWFEQCFAMLGGVEIDWRYGEGDEVAADAELAHLKASARVILSGERSALNFLQLLSATATKTRALCRACPGLRIFDTRKTIPGLRAAQKYAVAVGGGHNQRLGLHDAYLLKENHLALLGDLNAAVRSVGATNLPLQVEVENLQQLQQALELGVRRILLDNFSHEQITAALRINASRAELEVSGGVASVGDCQKLAALGVTSVSIGALTKDIQAIDLSLLITP